MCGNKMSEQVANNDSNNVGAVLGNRTTGTDSSNVEELQALERSILAMQADDRRNAGGRTPSPKRAGEREGVEPERSSKSPRSLEEGVVRLGGATGDVETRGPAGAAAESPVGRLWEHRVRWGRFRW